MSNGKFRGVTGIRLVTRISSKNVTKQHLSKMLYVDINQGHSQEFLKGGSSTITELLEAGVWGHSPQPLRDFQYFNKSKLSKLLYFMQKVH